MQYEAVDISSKPGDLNKKVEQLERQLITKALQNTEGNPVKSANLLNISERKPKDIKLTNIT